MSESAD